MMERTHADPYTTPRPNDGMTRSLLRAIVECLHLPESDGGDAPEDDEPRRCTAVEHAIVQHVARYPTAHELADATGISKNTIQVALRRMVDRGVLVRTAKPNRGRELVYLLPEGGTRR